MAEKGQLSAPDIQRALLEPASVFATPEEALTHEKLTMEQKIEILWRWEYDAAELAVAVEEGMPGEDNGLLRRVMLALGALTGPIDMEHTGPTKHHGLARPAVKHP